VSSRKIARRYPTTLVGPWGAVAVTLALAMGAAITLGTDNTGVPRPIGFIVGALVAGLTVAGLPSFPTNAAVFVVLASGGFVLLRHAGEPGADGRLVLLFLVAAIATVVLTERVAASEETTLGERRPLWRGTAGVLGTVLAIVAVLATLLAPLVAAAMHQDVRHGADGNSLTDPASSDLLSFQQTMDTSVRPRLSNRVVMTVEADRPSYWRGTTYDTWDGRTWSRGGALNFSSLLPQPGNWQAVIPSPEDPAVDQGIPSRQTFTVHAPYLEELFAAASPVRVRSDRPVGQLADGTLVVRHDDALGNGSSYTVESRIPNATTARMEAAPPVPVPRNVQELDLAQPPATARLRLLADSITAHAPNAYAKEQAITAWLGQHTKYSLNAPASPKGAKDAVDYFVFESKRGWCEQIASALTVMLRLEGVPARVATGFATGDADAFTGRYTVRERDAHAWTEVYFPGIGWQGFDPTAHVPLAGDPAPSRTLAEWLRSHAVAAIVLLVAVGVVALFFIVLWPRVARRRSRSRATRASWAAGALARLESIGRRHDRPRREGETPRAYALALAKKVGDPVLAEVGEAIDGDGYGPPGTVRDEIRARFDAVLAAAARLRPARKRRRIKLST
jgi:transglutaminase-like putative cysteine protease